MEKWANWCVVRWKRAIAVALAITIVAAVGLALLRFDLTFYSIMPKNARATIELAEIIESFPSASSIVVVVSATPQTIKAATDDVAVSLLAPEFHDDIVRVDARIDDTFFVENGLMLLTSTQLKRLRALIVATAARNSGGSTGESKLATLEVRDLLKLLGGLTFTDGYYLNDAGDRALIFVQPSFTINDFTIFPKVIPEIERAVQEAAARHDAVAGLTGIVVVGKDEAETSQQGLELSAAIAILLILGILILVYRMWSVPIIAGAPLLLGVLWSAGFAGLILGRLNIMTAMYTVALIGLGVDYAIHLLTAYRQHRDDGIERREAVVASFTVSGRGVVVGAITTAIAFFALVFAKSDLVRELGIVAGVGILSELLAMLLIVPALLGWRASRLEKRERSGKPTGQSRFLDRVGRKVAKERDEKRYSSGRALITPLILVAATTLLGFFAPGIEVESNMMNMEAKGLESIELQDLMVEEFGAAPDTLLFLASSVEEASLISKKLETIEAVSAVDSISIYLPSETEQLERAIEIERLALVFEAILDNEGGELAPLARALWPMTVEPYIEVEDVPESVRSLYFADDGVRNLVTIIPADNLWELEERDRLLSDIASVTDRVTGMVLVADQMTVIAKIDGRTAAIAALIAIFVVLLIDFRNLTMALLNLIPLACAFLSLFGIMAILGIKFDFVNIIAVPLLIGIGIDDAVHVSHRYLHEGKGRMRRAVLRTGSAILLTTITTMIGFGSFIPSVMRAMRSTGIVLTLAMALAYLYSIVLHPALLVLVRERLKLSLSPVFMRGNGD